jgi:hypothetical protein
MATLFDLAPFRGTAATVFDRICADVRAYAGARPCLIACWTLRPDGSLACHWDFDLAPASLPSG